MKTELSEENSNKYAIHVDYTKLVLNVNFL